MPAATGGTAQACHGRGALATVRGVRRALLLTVALVALPGAALAAQPPRARRCRAVGRCAPSRPPPHRRRRPLPSRDSRRTGPPDPSRPPRAGRVAQAPSRGRGSGAQRVQPQGRGLGVRRQRPALPGALHRARTPRGFRWLLRFESVRRSAAVYLNGRRLGNNTDPYTPFTLRGPRAASGALERAARDRRQPQGPAPARGLVELGRHRAPGEPDSRRAGASARPGDDVAREVQGARQRLPSRAAGRRVLERNGVGEPRLDVRLRSPSGRRIRRAFAFRDSARERSG